MGIFSKRKDKNNEIQKGGKLYNTLHTVAIIGIFASLALYIIWALEIIPRSANMFGFIGTLFALCIAVFSGLYWVRLFEKKTFTKVAIVFMALTVVQTILWIVCFWMGVGVYKDFKGLIGGHDNADTIKHLTRTLNFIKATGIFSIQFSVANFVATNFTKYRKTLIVFQAIAGLSYLLFDFYVTYALSCVHIGTSTFAFTDKLHIFTNKIMWAVFVIALLYVSLSGNIIRSITSRRVENKILDEMEEDHNPLGAPQNRNAEKPEQQSTAERLEKLKSLLEQGLITQEEYDRKRSEILESV
ncbi:MAG: SHOCT domain-containing protein [Clostridiales bacterium]|nr:SHOCT domain-containing protein [Clostridiales bacterium]